MLRTVVRNIILLGNLVFVALLSVTYLTWYLNPETFWFVAILGLGYPYLLLLNLGFIVFWLYRRRWYFLFSTIGILIGWNLFTAVLGMTFKTPEAVGKDFSMMSYNVKVFGHPDNIYKPEKVIPVVRLIDSLNTSVVCMQEYNNSSSAAHKQQMQVVNEKYPYHYLGFPLEVSRRGSAVVTYSKYPIKNAETVRFEGSFNFFTFADILFENEMIRVYNCHLQSNRIDPHDIEMLDEFKLKYTEKELKGVKNIVKKLKNAYSFRATQVDSLKAHTRECPYPYIVVGDFNDPPFSYTYKRLMQIGSDAFTKSSAGVANTYVRKIRGFRIDYVFYSKEFEALDFEVYKRDYSDHYPVKAELKKKL